jgi:hypothetical protein
MQVACATGAGPEDAAAPMAMDAAAHEDAMASGRDAEARDAGPSDTGAPRDADGVPDAGAAMDASPPDTGIGICPLDLNAPCGSASDCADDIPAPTNCAACQPYNRSVCAPDGCSTPPPLTTADTVVYRFAVTAPVVPDLVSIAGFVLSANTAGGQVISCDDVYAGRVDLTTNCYNLLDTRGAEAIRPQGDLAMTFTRFASGQPTLFVVYGYRQMRTRGDPIGVSCGSGMVEGPGRGPTSFAGLPMRPR